MIEVQIILGHDRNGFTMIAEIWKKMGSRVKMRAFRNTSKKAFENPNTFFNVLYGAGQGAGSLQFI